jgi:hypothetical protein
MAKTSAGIGDECSSNRADARTSMRRFESAARAIRRCEPADYPQQSNILWLLTEYLAMRGVPSKPKALPELDGIGLWPV